MNYARMKKLRKIKEKIIDILLFPIRCVCTPIYNLSEKLKQNKRYSDKQIRKVIQYLIDYWMNDEENFYVLIDDGYNLSEYSNISTPFYMQWHMSWGWRGEYKKIKNKASHIYCYQEEDYLRIFKELCGEPMTLEEKQKWFNGYIFHQIKDRDICKIKMR